MNSKLAIALGAGTILVGTVGYIAGNFKGYTDGFNEGFSNGYWNGASDGIRVSLDLMPFVDCGIPKLNDKKESKPTFIKEDSLKVLNQPRSE